MKITLIIIAILIIALISSYAYYGGFKIIRFSVQPQQKIIMVYETVVGDYSHTKAITDKVYETLLKEENIQTTKGIGIFYDNPKYVAKEKLRSEVGCIVEGLDAETLAKLAQKYQVKTLDEANYIVTEFPTSNFLSTLIGIMRVYPALEQYTKEHGYQQTAVIEIYDVPNQKTIYQRQAIK